MNSSQMDLGELVIFQPVLQAYPQTLLDYYSTHIAGKFGMPLETLQQTTYQNTTISQISGSTSICPNTAIINTSTRIVQHPGHLQLCESTITSAMKLLQSNQPQTHIHCRRRSLLPFPGDTLSWLTGPATTKDIHSIKTWINQLIAIQTLQHNTLVHIVSILNITRYATQVNRHSINTLMDVVQTTSHNINNLYNLKTSLATSINFNHKILHIRSVFANLRDSLHYIQMVSTHTMEYINAAISGTLSPHVVPVIDLQKMLQHHIWHPYLQHYTYQFHQRTLYIATGTCILMS